MKKKIFIIGSKGFVGSYILKELKNSKFIKNKIIELNRSKYDFKSKEFARFLTKNIRKNDIIVNAAAVAPCKNLLQFKENCDLITNIHNSINKDLKVMIINISSDAIFPDFKGKINEKLSLNPNSLHGLMHLMREKIINLSSDNYLHLRPTLIYGYGDPHKGYGPNLFIKNILKNEEINLFGKGEEKRDHIHVEDLSKLILLCIKKKVKGELNCVTGETISFYKIAKLIKKISGKKIKINFSKRLGPMPHNGYRPFDNKKIYKLFPNFKFSKLDENLKKIIHKYEKK